MKIKSYLKTLFTKKSEYQKCKEDPIYFFKKYCIENFDESKFNNILFLPNSDIHICNGRQSGTTTSIILFILYDMFFNNNKTLYYIHGYNKRIILKKLSDIIKNVINLYSELSKDITIKLDKILYKNKSIQLFNTNIDSYRGHGHNVDIYFITDEYSILLQKDIIIYNSILLQLESFNYKIKTITSN